MHLTPGVYKGQKRVSDTLKLELQTTVNYPAWIRLCTNSMHSKSVSHFSSLNRKKCFTAQLWWWLLTIITNTHVYVAVCVHDMWVQVLWRPEDRVRSSGAGVRAVIRHPRQVLRSYSGRLQKQEVPLTAALPLASGVVLYSIDLLKNYKTNKIQSLF